MADHMAIISQGIFTAQNYVDKCLFLKLFFIICFRSHKKYSNTVVQKKEFSLSWLRKNISFTANLLTLAPLFSKEFWFFSFKNCVAKIVGTKLENVFANKMTKVRHVYSFIKPNGIWHWQPWWQLDRKQHHSNHVCQKSQMGNFIFALRVRSQCGNSSSRKRPVLFPFPQDFQWDILALEKAKEESFIPEKDLSIWVWLVSYNTTEK